MPSDLDAKDIKILSHLQENARITSSEMARKIYLSTSATNARIKRLEMCGYIKNYTVVLNKAKIDKKLSSFTGVQLNSNSQNSLDLFMEVINRSPEVVNCYQVNGDFDFILHIVVSDMQEFNEFYLNALGKFGNTGAIRTFFVMNELIAGNIIDLSNLTKR
jgi:DNA-binding Lrp family transcriptional regulator